MSFFDEIWGGISGAVGETWDGLTDATGKVFEHTLQTMKDSGNDTATLKDKEPVKGAATDGSTIVSPTSTSPSNTSTQWINGVDNNVVAVGGGVLGLLALVLVVKAVN